MVALTLLLILACSCVVIDAHLVNLKQACMKIQHGSAVGFNHFVRPVIMDEGQSDWETPLPSCPSRTVGAGVDVQACDDDKIPHVQITNNFTIAVHRTGSLRAYAVVMMKLHCTPKELKENKTSPV